MKLDGDSSSRILIVDDEVGIRETLSDILQYKGMDVTTAEKGSDALEILKSNTFDIVLLDFKMPGMSGSELFLHIKQRYGNMKVIFITAYYQQEIIDNVMGKGAIAVLQKPLDVKQLIQIIEELGSLPRENRD